MGTKKSKYVSPTPDPRLDAFRVFTLAEPVNADADSIRVQESTAGMTTVPGFFAAGDLVAGRKKQVYTAWDLAVDAVDTIDLRIRELKRDGKY